MTCREAVYSEDAVEYLINNYGSVRRIEEQYNPACYFTFDQSQAVFFKEISANVNVAEEIERYGYFAVPNVYGLMSQDALEDSGVLRLRRQPYLDLYGQGILIGFVDTGIDYTHEAFLNADGSSRILTLWDQTLQEGEGTGRFSYGRVFSQEELTENLNGENAVPLSQDENGHGTFLAGVAAGNEKEEDDFSGVAPLSQLVVVKCKQAKNIYRNYYGIPMDVPAYQENDILAGISYLLEVAEKEGKPIVICIAMGTNMGSHNGTSPLEIFMDRYTTVNNVAMVCCAGNEGNFAHHYRIGEKEDTIDIDVSDEIQGFMTQLWWRTPGSLFFNVISPGGEELGEVRAITGVRRSRNFTPENTRVDIYCGSIPEVTREQVVVFRFQSAKPGVWKIQVRFEYDNPGFHMWLPIAQFLEEPVEFRQPDPDTTICNPGTGEQLITISAYNTVENSLYLQSSRGFTPLERVKPEIVAPGVNISGPTARNGYGTMTGTGVAAAFFAGVAALFMQYYIDYQISGVVVRELAIRGAIPRGNPYPNTEFGFGILDAYTSIIED